MAALREEEFETFLKRRSAGMNGLLIHGADEAATALLARQAIAALGGGSEQIDVAAMKAAPGTFMDEVLARDMFGARATLVVDGADDFCLKFLDGAFAHEGEANFTLITAGNLGKNSKLRQAAEASKSFASLVVYEEDQERLMLRIRNILAGHKLKWADGAEDAFFAQVGGDRAIAVAEAEKLALYALGQSEITAANVTAICGDTAEFGVDDIIDAVLSGDLEATDRMLSAQGADQRSLFILLLQHIARLQNFCLDMEKGMNADAAVRNAKPPVFFKRRNAIISQLRKFALSDLIEMGETVQAAILATRKHADLAEALTSRTLLSLARAARAKRAA